MAAGRLAAPPCAPRRRRNSTPPSTDRVAKVQWPRAPTRAMSLRTDSGLSRWDLLTLRRIVQRAGWVSTGSPRAVKGAAARRTIAAITPASLASAPRSRGAHHPQARSDCLACCSPSWPAPAARHVAGSHAVAGEPGHPQRARVHVENSDEQRRADRAVRGGAGRGGAGEYAAHGRREPVHRAQAGVGEAEASEPEVGRCRFSLSDQICEIGDRLRHGVRAEWYGIKHGRGQQRAPSLLHAGFTCVDARRTRSRGVAARAARPPREEGGPAARGGLSRRLAPRSRGAGPRGARCRDRRGPGEARRG